MIKWLIMEVFDMVLKNIKRRKMENIIRMFAADGLITYNEWKSLINRYSS